METSALNAAHEIERRAEALLREGKFEEAAKCHERVANLLTEAHFQMEARQLGSPNQGSTGIRTSVQSLATLESLALQRDYHNRQASIVRMKKSRYEEYKATLESQRREFFNTQEVNNRFDEDSVHEVLGEKCECSLRQAIYRTIEEQDSLLNVLELPHAEKNKENQAFKHPKDTGTVIEELRTVNSQLRSLVGSLLSQLEVKEQQVRQLTERLHAASAGSSEETRADDSHSLRLAPLPPLTPLEMPRFDFNST